MTDLIAQALVSLIVLVMFGGTVTLVLLNGVPSGAETVANVLLGTLGTMATGVVSYWIGSSRGSARKTEILAQSQPTEPSKTNGP